MSNDPNAEPRHFCGECEHFREIDWRFRWKGAPYMFACYKSDDADEIVLVTDDMEACRDWRES